MTSVKTSLTPTRRALLARAAAAPALALPAVALAAPDTDPHPDWYREWKACLDWCNGPGGRDVQEFPQWDRLEELEELICTTPSRSLAGAVAQVRVFRYWIGDSAYGGEDLDTGLANALATLERLAGEAGA